MKITAYNTFGTKDASRVVASYESETADFREALNEARYRAAIWNKTETRENMKVRFILANGHLTTVESL